MINSEKKLLCTDLDGTLLNTDKIITEKTLNAIRLMIKSGHSFAFSTGRPVQSAIPLAQKYGFMDLPGFYIVSYNGALIYECCTHKTIYTCPFERKYLIRHKTSIADERRIETYESFSNSCEIYPKEA